MYVLKCDRCRSKDVTMRINGLCYDCYMKVNSKKNRPKNKKYLKAKSN